MAFADAGCILKVDFHCEACRMHLVEVLSSVIGVYNVACDGDYWKITGEMDPNRLIKAVARTGSHAKLIKATFKHPSWDAYNSTSLDYHQWAANPAHALAGMHGGVDPIHGGHGYADPIYGGGAGFAGMHHPCGGLGFAEDYPFPPAGNGFHHRRPAMGAGFGGPWRQSHAFGGGPWFGHM